MCSVTERSDVESQEARVCVSGNNGEKTTDPGSPPSAAGGGADIPPGLLTKTKRVRKYLVSYCNSPDHMNADCPLCHYVYVPDEDVLERNSNLLEGDTI